MSSYPSNSVKYKFAIKDEIMHTDLGDAYPNLKIRALEPVVSTSERVLDILVEVIDVDVISPETSAIHSYIGSGPIQSRKLLREVVAKSSKRDLHFLNSGSLIGERHL